MTTIEQLQAMLCTKPMMITSEISHKPLTPVVKCVDGCSLSVQASEDHYCTPRNNEGPYIEVEVWCISHPESVTQFDYDDAEPSAYTPIESVAAFIDAHGGIA